ncbi:MAG: hypothetical protein J7L14_01715 [Candidatus Diapherotrites archaeon]|nr:hypothetical protein [Candidatus Diapherotrites archaeon]
MAGETRAAAVKSSGIGALFEEVADLVGVKDLAEAGSRKFKLWAFKNTVGDLWFRDLFSMFENPDTLIQLEKPKAIPYHPKHISEIFYTALDKTIEISAWVGEEIGSESIMEMLSEGLSSALESNFNGGLQTILNVWKGSLPPDVSYSQMLGQRADLLKTKYAASILAPTSALPYTILEGLIQGGFTRLQTLYQLTDQEVISLLQTKNQQLIAHITALGSFINNVLSDLIFDAVQFADRLENVVNTMVNVAVERLIAILDDVNAIQTRYDVGLVTDEDYNDFLAEKDADADAINELLTQIQTDIDNLISDYLSVLDGIINDIVSIVTNYYNLFESTINEQINALVSEINDIGVDTTIKNNIKEVYERLRAYRQCGFDYV